MAGVEWSQKALKDLQESVHDRAIDLVKLKGGKPADNWDSQATSDFGGDIPAKRPESKIFGKLPNSEGMSGAVESVENKMGEELGTAKSRLDGVERALDDVIKNVTNANSASGGKGE
ncbi:hypothetical protein [Nonomuraea sediminis]|uniref:hypothetical protein n=1 Tax=Nonomuraea sediminis TaxID=2835864 RepID=UPI001BDBC1B4|nr:hypothetical protein [Nonomuraea sediminis]